MDIKRVIKIRNELQGFINKQRTQNYFYLQNGILRFFEDDKCHTLDYYAELRDECNAYLPENVLLQSTYRKTENVIFDLCFEAYSESDIGVDRYDEIQNMLKKL